MLKIDALIAANPEDYDLFGPCPEEIIRFVEQSLHVRFPKTLREFIAKYGGGGNTEFVSGIVANDPLNKSRGTILGDTTRNRNQFGLPSSYVVVVMQDYDEFLCLDTESIDENLIFFDTVHGTLSDPFKRKETFDDYTFFMFSEE